MFFCHWCRRRLCGSQGNVLLFVRPWMEIVDMNHDASVVFMNTNAISAFIGVRSMLRCRCLTSFSTNSELYGVRCSHFSECRIYSVLFFYDSLNPPIEVCSLITCYLSPCQPTLNSHTWLSPPSSHSTVCLLSASADSSDLFTSQIQPRGQI